MYLEIDEGFDSHPKTLRLCRVLNDVNAGQYLFRLWTWACRSAPDGDLSGMGAEEIEALVRYAPADGKLFVALTERWSTKYGPWLEKDGDRLTIHGWAERTGAAIKRMEAAADRKKLYRAHKEKRCGTDCEWCKKERETSKERPRTVHGRDQGQAEDESRTNRGLSDTVQSSPVQSRQDTLDPDPDPHTHTRARDPLGPPLAAPGKPSAYNVVSKFLAIRSEVLSGVPGFKGISANPQPGDVAKAAAWLEAMPADEVADIEPAIRLACRKVKAGHPGWTNPGLTGVAMLWGSILGHWIDLREEIHGCAPKVAAKPTTGSAPAARPLKTFDVPRGAR